MENQSIGVRLKKAWNAFLNRDPTPLYGNYGVSYSSRPDRPRLTRGNERSIITSIFNRIAIDVAAVDIRHCKLDDDGRYISDVDSGLNRCLNLEANIDQTGRAFIQDAVMSMLDEGCVALIPTETNVNPMFTNSYKIFSMRVGKIVEWKPDQVRVYAYNKLRGEKQDIWCLKKNIAIIENPLYAIVNEPNSTFQRLKRKLALMDVTDERTASNKLDLIVQLPYTVKTPIKRDRANRRMEDLTSQLTGSAYGVGWIDATEKVIQLNRSVENNLLAQVEYLTNMVYSQLGITQAILDGTADEKTMLNYNNRTVEPIVSAITDELKRKFLTDTARSQNQSIKAFKDPFKLVPVNDIAEIADKFTRNEILTSNEIRQIIGIKPSNDPKADQLINSNIAQPNIGNDEDSNAGGFLDTPVSQLMNQ